MAQRGNAQGRRRQAHGAGVAPKDADTEYDLIVLGSGAAGSSAATTAAQAGRRVALIERGVLGGTCLNYGCDPTKTLLHTARLFTQARQADRYGLRIPTASADWSAVVARAQQVITRMRGGNPAQAARALRTQGVTVFHGEAQFVAPDAVEVNGTRLRGANIMIATGAENIIPPIEGLREAGYITNIEAVTLPALPQRLAIIGGGANGIEFAQIFTRFGVAVTLLERSNAVLDTEDQELACMLVEQLRADGVRIETQAEVRRVEAISEGKRLTIQCADRREEALDVDQVLLALGRKPALDGLGLDAAGVVYDEHGVQVDATLRTNVAHIWAAGDALGRYQFTHVASAQGELAARNAFAEQRQPFDERVIPWAIFTEPELARVGRTEEQLRQQGQTFRVLRVSFEDVERAIITGQTAGEVKLLTDQDGAVLGCHILAVNAGELIAPVVLALRAGLPAQALGDLLLPYPTMAEAVRNAARGA
ncbi:MAG: FAD-dependent oxidoreductase [Ktedonobacterales bacterium]